MYTEECIQTFLEKQGQLFDEPVAETLEEADEFLDDCCAVIQDSKKDTLSYMKDNLDCEGMDDDEILESAEVFDIGDGRYLIVEG